MAASNRSKALDLHTHNPVQRSVFVLLALICIVVLYVAVAVPAMDSFFLSFLRMDTVRDGSVATFAIGESRSDTVTTGLYSTWALVEHASTPQIAIAQQTAVLKANYVFRPTLALMPLVVVGGVLISTLLTVGFPSGYARQKIEREILTFLDRLAVLRFGEHTTSEIQQLRTEIVRADLRRLHDLASEYGIAFQDLELLQGALRWEQSSGFSRLRRSHDAIKFYMREYFTDRYSNVILGAVYIGAAVLIIVIGIRGLKFLPATDPSLVMGALGLEFMLLVTYAVILMYGRAEESGALGDLHAPSASVDHIDAESEQVLRSFLAIRRSASTDGVQR